MPESSDLPIFNRGTFMPDMFTFAPFSTMELSLAKELELSCQISSNSLLFTHRFELKERERESWAFAGVRCLLPSINEGLMSDEVNSITGKKERNKQTKSRKN